MRFNRYSIVWLMMIVSVIEITFSNGQFCPKVCKVCFQHHLSCTDGGLLSIPTNIYKETTKITLIGHNFDDPILTKSNFTNFAKPFFNIEQLSIRRSNINIIEPKTFSDLTGLDNLDLSDNKRIVIRYMAFFNLKLKHLKLDDIENLEIQTGAFEGLMVLSLSIKNSRLKTLDYQIIRPIASKLNNLFLNKNQLSYLDEKYQKLFPRLYKLQLTENPWICSCNLSWLSPIMLQRLKKSQSDRNTFSYSESIDDYPKCTGPTHLHNRFIHNITKNEFNCDAPVLNMIDVYFEKPNTVRLTCSAVLSTREAALNVFWQQISKTNIVSYPEMNKLEKYKAVTVIEKDDTVSSYRCIAKSDNGNATIKLAINWPNFTVNTNPKDSQSNKNDNFNQNIIHKNFFFREQFTLLELMGAVLGTFTVTLTVFLLLYRFCFKHQDMKLFLSTNSHNSTGNHHPHHNLNQNPKKPAGYSIYETGMYSDSQTYDIPHINNTSLNNNCPSYTQTLLNKPHLASTNTPSHFIDYRTQQKIST